MMELIGNIQHALHTVFEGIQSQYTNYVESGDPRTQHLFGVNTPWFVVITIGSYILLVTTIGPRLMKNREPFQLRKVLIVYNLFVVLLNLYVAIKSFIHGTLRYNLFCEPSSYDATPEEFAMVYVSYTYFISKFIELLDTVFFVLRKKDRQLSFLHIFHHSIMPLNVYSGMKFMATGHVTFFGQVNSLVHVPMYTYYMLAAIGPHMQKYLWWKKYLTTMQLVQFVIVFCHSISGFVGSCDTESINPLLYILTVNSCIFMLLFSNFYKVNYLQNKVKAQANGVAKEAEKGAHQTNGHAAYVEELETKKEVIEDSPARVLRSRSERLKRMH